MSAELGVGTRVWIGYGLYPEGDSAYAARCRTGVVTRSADDHPRARRLGCRAWSVLPDGINKEVAVEECLLYPIDDGDHEATPTEHELETTT